MNRGLAASTALWHAQHYTACTYTPTTDPENQTEPIHPPQPTSTNFKPILTPTPTNSKQPYPRPPPGQVRLHDVLGHRPPPPQPAGAAAAVRLAAVTLPVRVVVAGAAVRWPCSTCKRRPSPCFLVHVAAATTRTFCMRMAAYGTTDAVRRATPRRARPNPHPTHTATWCTPCPAPTFLAEGRRPRRVQAQARHARSSSCCCSCRGRGPCVLCSSGMLLLPLLLHHGAGPQVGGLKGRDGGAGAGGRGGRCGCAAAAASAAGGSGARARWPCTGSHGHTCARTLTSTGMAAVCFRGVTGALSWGAACGCVSRAHSNHTTSAASAHVHMCVHSVCSPHHPTPSTPPLPPHPAQAPCAPVPPSLRRQARAY